MILLKWRIDKGGEFLKKIHFSLRVILIAFAIIFGIISISILISVDSENFPLSFSDGIDLTTGWISADGTVCDLSSMPVGKADVSYDVSSFRDRDRYFCAKSIDTYFDIYADGQMIYSYQKNIPDIAGISYGLNIHTVSFGNDVNELRLVMTPAFDWEKPLLADVRAVDPNVYLNDHFIHELPNFCMCVLMMLIGVVIIVIGSKGMRRVEFITLGLFACFTSLWSVNDTYILQFLTQRPDAVRAVSYICFALMPYPPLAFVSVITKNKRQLLLTLITIAISLYTILFMILNMTGIADFHVTVRYSRVSIVVSMLISLAFMLIALRKGGLDKKLLSTLAIGVAFATSGSIIDFLRLFLTDSAVVGSGLFTRLGIFVFLILFVYYIITDYSRVRLENNKAQMIKKLAYTDSLTGLNNRLAFNEKEKSLVSDEKKGCIVVQLDINNLKLVNDVYGHQEGDKHIKAAASAIHESFSELGSCYRTGGDEFLVIVSSSDKEKAVIKAIEKMKSNAAAYNERENPPVTLQIAYGYAICEDTSKDLDAAEHLADQRMYECKRRMKENDPLREKAAALRA